MRMKGMGYQIRIPVILKNKWARATCSASVPSDTMAAMIAVMVVPILAPNDKGYICSRRRTPIPTKGVKADVVIDEDWTRMVIPHPINIPRYPFMLVALYTMRVDTPKSIF